MDEFLIVNNVKEKLCYVAQNFLEELEATKKTIAQGNTNVMEYVLPVRNRRNNTTTKRMDRYSFSRFASMPIHLRWINAFLSSGYLLCSQRTYTH